MAAKPASVIFSIIRLRNGVIACSLLLDDRTTPSQRRQYLHHGRSGDPAIPYGGAVPFNANEAAIRRLFGASLLDQNVEWAVLQCDRYVTLESVASVSDHAIVSLAHVEG